ncbi:MAG TPA: hypothetical protein VF719_10520, partial [Abditibacteriaceae bacterium]
MAQIEFVNLADIGGDDLGDELNGRFNALKVISNLGLHMRGNYDPLFNYRLNDVVKHNGSLWRALGDLLGVTPVEGASWTEIAGPVTAIPATKIANGTVDNTEFQHLNGVTSAIQGQINARATTQALSDLQQAQEVVTNSITTTLNAHTGNTSNPHATTKAQVGLGNVTNDAQIPLIQKGANSGVAELDSSGFLPIARIPASLLG